MEHAAVPALDTQWSPVTPVLEQTLLTSSLRERLRILRELPQDWNSYGSPPISESVVGTSLALLGNLRNLKMAEPLISPIGGGGLQLEWQNESCELEIEIRPDQQIEYLIVDRQGEMLEGRISGPHDTRISCLTHWFLIEAEGVDDLLNPNGPAY